MAQRTCLADADFMTPCLLASFVPQPEEPWSVPACTRDRQGELRKTWVGLAVPGKTISKHRHPVHLSVPFAAQHGAGPKLCAETPQGHGALSGSLRAVRSVEQPLTLCVEVTPTLGLQSVGQNAEQEMTRQVRGCRPPPH